MNCFLISLSNSNNLYDSNLLQNNILNNLTKINDKNNIYIEHIFCDIYFQIKKEADYYTLNIKDMLLKHNENDFNIKKMITDFNDLSVEKINNKVNDLKAKRDIILKLENQEKNINFDIIKNETELSDIFMKNCNDINVYSIQFYKIVDDIINERNNLTDKLKHIEDYIAKSKHKNNKDFNYYYAKYLKNNDIIKQKMLNISEIINNKENKSNLNMIKYKNKLLRMLSYFNKNNKINSKINELEGIITEFYQKIEYLNSDNILNDIKIVN